MKGKSYRIEVVDLSKLEKYGFVKTPKKPQLTFLKYEYAYYWYSGNTDRYGKKVYCISVYDDDSKVNMDTCGGAALKVLCEMFRDGIVRFVPCGMTTEKRIEIKKKQIEKLKKEIEALKGE